MHVGVYPDGVETEQSSSYHMVATGNFNGIVASTLDAGRPLNPVLNSTVRDMFAYTALSMDPAGFNPLNSDSDLENTTSYVLEAAAEFGDCDDWVFAATHGAQGTAPAGAASQMFPWTGQFIMRSGWDQGAQWAWFDVGP